MLIVETAETSREAKRGKREERTTPRLLENRMCCCQQEERHKMRTTNCRYPNQASANI